MDGNLEKVYVNDSDYQCIVIYFIAVRSLNEPMLLDPRSHIRLECRLQHPGQFILTVAAAYRSDTITQCLAGAEADRVYNVGRYERSLDMRAGQYSRELQTQDEG